MKKTKTQRKIQKERAGIGTLKEYELTQKRTSLKIIIHKGFMELSSCLLSTIVQANTGFINKCIKFTF